MWSLHKLDWQPFLSGLASEDQWTTISEGTKPGEWHVTEPGSAPKASDEGGLLSAEDNSIQNLALLLAPNRISMSTFYMLLAEARRAVMADGLLVVITKDLPNGLLERINDIWCRTIQGDAQSLDPEHYVSPEHWKLIKRERHHARCLPLVRAAFRRTTFT